jgi:hypothetical protein
MNINEYNKDHYQAFLGVLIDLIVELLGLIIKPFDNLPNVYSQIKQSRLKPLSQSI